MDRSDVIVMAGCAAAALIFGLVETLSTCMHLTC